MLPKKNIKYPDNHRPHTGLSFISNIKMLKILNPCQLPADLALYAMSPLNASEEIWQHAIEQEYQVT
jgi:hypothetical protein